MHPGGQHALPSRKFSFLRVQYERCVSALRYRLMSPTPPPRSALASGWYSEIIRRASSSCKRWLRALNGVAAASCPQGASAPAAADAAMIMLLGPCQKTGGRWDTKITRLWAAPLISHCCAGSSYASSLYSGEGASFPTQKKKTRTKAVSPRASLHTVRSRALPIANSVSAFIVQGC